MRAAAPWLLWALLSCVACSAFQSTVGPDNELVLHPGDGIVAKTPNGALSIDAPDVQTRRYRWGTQDRTAQLAARSERWYGALGIYGQSGDLVAEEAQYDFASERAFRFWIHQYSPPKVYSRDGYVVGLGPAPNGNTDIDLYHVCIAGKTPANLAGGDDAAVRFKRAPQSASGLTAWYGCARQTYDPIAEQRSSLRESLDIARQVSFWNETSCDVTGPESGNAAVLGPVPGVTELVLLPGERLRAVNRNGPVTVEAPDERSRILGWTGDNPRPAGFKSQADPQRTVSVGLLAARTRSDGALGAIGCKRLAGNQEYTADFEEAQLNFASLGDFAFWRSWLTHGALYLDYVYRNDGLLVGYGLGHDSGMSPMINVDLYQICIGGKKPRTLPGANDAAIALTSGAAAGAKQARYGCAAATFSPHTAFAAYEHQYQGDEEAARQIESFETQP